MKVNISVVITTKNEEKTLGDLLNSLNKQTFKDFEVIVVDNNSSDKTKEIAKNFGCRVYNFGPERSAQRNFGVIKSKGECVLILDADMSLTSEVLADCWKIIKTGRFAALIIPEKSYGQGFWTRFKIFEREFYVGEDDYEAARFFKRDVFLKFGGYNEAITGPEDYELPLRLKKAGLKIGRIKSYINHNEKKFSPLKSAKKKFYYASKASKYHLNHPEMLLKQGNLLFRPVYFRKWKKLLSNPGLSVGMFLVRSVEMSGALLGYIYSGIIGKVNGKNK